MVTGYLTQSEAAGALGVSEQTLRNWRRAEKGPPWRMHGLRAAVYGREDLVRWCEENNVAYHFPAEADAEAAS